MTQPQYDPSAAWQPPKPRPWWLWPLIIVLVFAGLIAMGLIFRNNQPEPSPSPWGWSGHETDTLPLTPAEPYLAILELSGQMSVNSNYAAVYGYDHQWLLDKLDMLMADDYNAGLLLYVNSGGGEVTAAAELAEKLAEYQDYTGRPVVAFGYGLNASGAYWASCAADEMILDRYCITGSLGVTFGTMLDVSGLLERYDVTAYNVASGEEKNALNGLTPFTEEAVDIYRVIANEYYGYFTGWIASCRGLDEARVRELADGRIYSATQAVEVGLADKVGGYGDAVARLTALTGVDYTVELTAPESFTSLLDILMRSELSETELAALLGAMDDTPGALAYYQGL